jgi:probable FeS assembly SUF system protein SufT
MREQRTLTREVEAVAIPYGHTVRLPQGTVVWLEQLLGGSATISVPRGGLYRVEAEAFDALGLEVPEEVRAGLDLSVPLEGRIWQILKTCYDPEIPVNIVDLGLIYDLEIEPSTEDGKHRVRLKMTLTAPGCGMADVLAKDIERKLSKLPDVQSVVVEVVFDPPWNAEMMSEAARLQLGFF